MIEIKNKTRSLTIEFETIVRAQNVRLLRASRAVLVRQWTGTALLDLLQQRREQLPGLQQFVGANEMHLRAEEHVQDQSRVGLRQIDALVARVVGQVQFGLLDIERDARRLAHHLAVDRLARLHSNHQLVSLAFA